MFSLCGNDNTRDETENEVDDLRASTCTVGSLIKESSRQCTKGREGGSRTTRLRIPKCFETTEMALGAPLVRRRFLAKEAKSLAALFVGVARRGKTRTSAVKNRDHALIVVENTCWAGAESFVFLFLSKGIALCGTRALQKGGGESFLVLIAGCFGVEERWDS